MSNDWYPDVPIDPERQFRVLTLLPGEFQQVHFHLSGEYPHSEDNSEEHDIVCTLEAVSLSSKVAANAWPSEASPVYDALSYAWAQSKGDFYISLGVQHSGDGLIQRARYRVTPNLWHALRRLRQSQLPRKLWVDQICIDQSNTNERNHQVGIMERIYGGASNVHVWLGEEQHTINQYEAKWRWHDEFHLPVERMECLKSVIDHCSHRWWDRIWVVQEVAKAQQDPIFLYGPYTLPWRIIRDLDIPAPETTMWALRAAVRSFRPSNWNPGARQSLREKMDIISGTQSTDPKDKVYALLGLSSETEKRLIVPDYDSQDYQVFALATYASMISSGTFTMLAFAMMHPVTAHSWVYNFAGNRGRSSNHTHLGGVLEGLPVEVIGASRRTKLAVDLLSNECALETKALVLGEVTRVKGIDIAPLYVPAYQDSAGGLQDLENTGNLMEDWYTLKATTSLSQRQDKMLERLAVRILCRDPGLFPWYRLFMLGHSQLTAVASTSGCLGLAAANAETGDVLVLPYGCQTPMVVRQVQSSSKYTFQGFAYVPEVTEDDFGDAILEDFGPAVKITLI